MSLKSRFLRITLIVLGVLAFAGYFAFATFLYDPLEGDLDYDVAALAPRDVDFYASKADLRALLQPFPDLAAKKQLEENAAWNAWTSSPEYQDLARSTRLEETLAQTYDPYAFIRDAYLEQRRFQVYDGNPPEEPIEDESGEDEAGASP